MNESRVFTGKIGDKEVIIETGKLAQQAGGAVTVRMGDTMLFCAVTMSKSVREGMDFFPLSVEYEEKLYAGGRVPGSFLRREGRPSDRAVLVSRVIDRTLRPLFPKYMRNEVQIFVMSLSTDFENQIDMLGILAASAALTISDIPWNGPVAGARVGYIDGQLVLNPLLNHMDQTKLDLRVSGTADAINMVECAADNISEDIVLEALNMAHNAIKPIIDLQLKMREEIGKEKSEYSEILVNETLNLEVRERVSADVARIVSENTDRHELSAAMSEFSKSIIAEYETRNESLPEEEQVSLKDVGQGIDLALKAEVRRRIAEEGIRPDGRDTRTIRSLSAEVGLIPRVHGSSLFQRGETQVLNILTLGTPRDAQLLDDLDLAENKRYMHHYNFPPYSTGETWPSRGPKRREIGHGILAENALLPVLPSEREFAYTLRLVSEVMSSNGSTSMASVCASTLSLMDAGVPIKMPVAGIAMGLIKEGEHVAILTDIQGMEDHLGDMDFKVAGTKEGITALQMDIKISGVTDEIMRQALYQAREARLQILDVMLKAIATPRTELNPNAPRMETIQINPEKIGAVIGQGGKTIRSIQEDTKTTIEISEDGLVFVTGPDGPSVMASLDRIRGLTTDPELGKVYTGRVTRVESYGCFVEFLTGKEGMVHISQLADYRVEDINNEVKVGDEIMVMVIDIDPGGRVRLSRQAVLEGWTVEQAREKDQKGRSRSNDRNSDRRGRSDRGERSSDRRSSED